MTTTAANYKSTKASDIAVLRLFQTYSGTLEQYLLLVYRTSGRIETHKYWSVEGAKTKALELAPRLDVSKLEVERV